MAMLFDDLARATIRARLGRAYGLQRESSDCFWVRLRLGDVALRLHPQGAGRNRRPPDRDRPRGSSHHGLRAECATSGPWRWDGECLRPSDHRRSRALRNCRLAIPSSGRNIAAASAHAALRGGGREGRVRPRVEHSQGTRADRADPEGNRARSRWRSRSASGAVPSVRRNLAESTAWLPGRAPQRGVRVSYAPSAAASRVDRRGGSGRRRA
jgi:hypothetical protein